MSTPPEGETARILKGMESGDAHAASQLVPLVYDELRKLAAHYLGSERPEHTLQPTALVHEAYLRLIGSQAIRWESRAHFLGAAAQAMRHILVDHAKRRQAAKRGGGQIRLSLDEALDFAPERDAHLVALDEALTGLSSVQAELCRIVELRFFGGLTVEETSRVMGMSPKTVQRKWALARSWLHREITRS